MKTGNVLIKGSVLSLIITLMGCSSAPVNSDQPLWVGQYYEGTCSEVYLDYFIVED